MPRLASIEEFATHFNSVADDEIRPVIARALDLATYYIEKTLGTEFEKSSVVDKFTVTGHHPRVHGDKIILRLSSGFVRKDVEPYLQYYVGRSGELIDAPEGSFDCDYSKGLLVVAEDKLLEGFPGLQSMTPGLWLNLLVGYDKGYDIEDKEGFGDSYVDVPYTLRELCVVQAIEVYNLLADEKEPKFTVLATSHALDRYTRFHAARVMPYSSNGD